MEFEIQDGVLLKYNGNGGDVVIPDGVTAIGDRAFRECGNVTGIVLPDGVTSIGNLAFCRCGSLRNIAIPNSVTAIDNRAFFGCKSLTSITIPKGVTAMGRRLFFGCEGLTSVTLPDSMSVIDGETFRGCKSLASITAPGVPFSVMEKQKQQRSATMGYLAHAERYKDPAIIAAYREYMNEYEMEIVPALLKQDLAQGIAEYAAAGMIVASNIDRSFLNPAIAAKATQCVAFLLEWKSKNVGWSGEVTFKGL